jgi:hypothetical protein
MQHNHGELSAAVELRRLFPGITDNAKARECVRSIAGWRPVVSAAGQGGSSAASGLTAGHSPVGMSTSLP